MKWIGRHWLQTFCAVSGSLRPCSPSLCRHLSVGVSPPADRDHGFSVQLLDLLSQQHGDGRSSLACSSEVLSRARGMFVEAMGADGQGTAPETLADRVRQHYQSLESREERQGFFSVLAGDLGVEHDAVLDRATHLVEVHSQHRTENAVLKSEAGLRLSLSPFYSELFAMIARLEGGIKFLVDIRGDLLSIGKQLQESGSPDHHLMELSQHLKETLGQWFTPQLLDLCQVTWQSPCDLLEKISSYEAVHPLRHWKDLKHRLGANRRCFVFMHKAIPREPIVILHVALTREPSSSIQTLLNRMRTENLENVSTANFYSISSTQKGLSGVELGNFLIRRVVRALQQEFPQELKTFVTLSPIPGFKSWLDTYLRLSIEHEQPGLAMSELEPLVEMFPEVSSPTQALMSALENPFLWARDDSGQLAQSLQAPLTKLCARYLASVKRRGYAIDPVAHFHLQNGASIWRLNWMGDVGYNGMRRSYGLMANYLYDLPDITSNSDSYRASGHVPLSESLHTLLS